ncbi:MAG: TetR/AcrR family transcriptional regulator [Alphaproteobacteria bacterium]
MGTSDVTEATALKVRGEEVPAQGRSRSRAAMEKRILSAAAAVFSEAGFDAATTAAIAERAGLPKANVHYYFRTKDLLYQKVLADVLDAWIEQMDFFTAEADPAQALRSYIHAKVALARCYPIESRVFANEMLHGAPYLRRFLGGKLRRRVDQIAVVFESWAKAGKIAADVDAHFLLFTLWAATQTYADFDVQVGAVLGVDELCDEDYERASAQLTALVLRGCGLKS